MSNKDDTGGVGSSGGGSAGRGSGGSRDNTPLSIWRPDFPTRREADELVSSVVPQNLVLREIVYGVSRSNTAASPVLTSTELKVENIVTTTTAPSATSTVLQHQQHQYDQQHQLQQKHHHSLPSSSTHINTTSPVRMQHLEQQEYHHASSKQLELSLQLPEVYNRAMEQYQRYYVEHQLQQAQHHLTSSLMQINITSPVSMHQQQQQEYPHRSSKKLEFSPQLAEVYNTTTEQDQQHYLQDQQQEHHQSSSSPIHIITTSPVSRHQQQQQNYPHISSSYLIMEQHQKHYEHDQQQRQRQSSSYSTQINTTSSASIQQQRQQEYAHTPSKKPKPLPPLVESCTIIMPQHQQHYQQQINIESLASIQQQRQYEYPHTSSKKPKSSPQLVESCTIIIPQHQQHYQQQINTESLASIQQQRQYEYPHTSSMKPKSSPPLVESCTIIMPQHQQQINTESLASIQQQRQYEYPHTSSKKPNFLAIPQVPSSLTSASEGSQAGGSKELSVSPETLLRRDRQNRAYLHLKNLIVQLHSLVPQLRSQEVRLTRATTLEQAAQYIKQLRRESALVNESVGAMLADRHFHRASIKRLHRDLPISVSRQSFDRMRELYEQYVRRRTQDNWKFWIMGLVMEPLLTSYNSNVFGEVLADVTRTSILWVDKRYSLVSLRAAVSNKLKYLSTNTDALSDPPSNLQDEVAKAVNNTEDEHPNLFGP